MKTIVLHGAFADHIPGGRFNCEFQTAREAASALEINFPGFFKLISDGYIHIKAGENHHGMDESQLMAWKIQSDELHIMPAVEGSGGGGGDNGGNRGVKAILGLALVAVAIIGTGGLAGITGGSLSTAVFGNSFGITGMQLLQLAVPLVMSAFAPAPPSNKDVERVENVIYTGPLSTNAEGDVLPYVAGERVIVGGVIFNSELIVENTK